MCAMDRKRYSNKIRTPAIAYQTITTYVFWRVLNTSKSMFLVAASVNLLLGTLKVLQKS